MQCSNLSLLSLIVQHLPELISVKVPLSLPLSITKETSQLIKQAHKSTFFPPPEILTAFSILRHVWLSVVKRNEETVELCLDVHNWH